MKFTGVSGSLLAKLGAWLLVLLLLGLASSTGRAQAALSSATPPGKLAPRPLYRDPPFEAPTDPVLCFNAEQNKWFMYYTARRATATNAPGVSWVHGSNIGLAESSDGGATSWKTSSWPAIPISPRTLTSNPSASGRSKRYHSKPTALD